MVSQNNFLRQNFVGNLLIGLWIVCYFIVLYKLWPAADHDVPLFSVYAGIETIVIPLFLWGCLRAQDSDNIFFMVSTMIFCAVTVGVIFNKPFEVSLMVTGIAVVIGVAILGLVQGRLPVARFIPPGINFLWIYKKDSPADFWAFFVIEIIAGIFFLAIGSMFFLYGKTTYEHGNAYETVDFNSQAEVFLNKGLDDDIRKDYAQAIVDYTQAIKINSKWAHAYNKRGNDYLKNNPALAMADYNKAIELDPKNGVFYSNRGNAYFKLGNFNQAILDYSNSILLNPNYTRAYSKRARAYFMLKKYDIAWTDVHKLQTLGKKVDPSFLSDLKKASGTDQ